MFSFTYLFILSYFLHLRIFTYLLPWLTKDICIYVPMYVSLYQSIYRSITYGCVRYTRQCINVHLLVGERGEGAYVQTNLRTKKESTDTRALTTA